MMNPSWSSGTDQLIWQDGPVCDFLFEIELPDPGARAFSFTFG